MKRLRALISLALAVGLVALWAAPATAERIYQVDAASGRIVGMAKAASAGQAAAWEAEGYLVMTGPRLDNWRAHKVVAGKLAPMSPAEAQTASAARRRARLKLALELVEQRLLAVKASAAHATDPVDMSAQQALLEQRRAALVGLLNQQAEPAP